MDVFINDSSEKKELVNFQGVIYGTKNRFIAWVKVIQQQRTAAGTGISRVDVLLKGATQWACWG